MISKLYDNLYPLGNTKGILLFKKTLIYSFTLLLINCGSSQAKLEIKENKKSFGTVKRGEVVALDYVLLNAGNEPLILKSAEVSCSCTSVDFEREPIQPGKSSLIKVKFNTETVYGRQDREVIISSNNPGGDVYIRYKGNVSKK